jgi:hypothetical protein
MTLSSQGAHAPSKRSRPNRCLSTRQMNRGIADQVALPEAAGFDEETVQLLCA